MTNAVLLPALDRLLEAASEAERMAVIVPLEDRLERGMMRAFRSQGYRFMRYFKQLRPLWVDPIPLREAIEPRDWEPLFTAAEELTLLLFRRPLNAVAARALLSGARTALADLGLEISFDLENPRAVAYLQTVPNRVAGINMTTRAEIQRILLKGVEDGWSYDRTAKALQDKFKAFRTPQPQLHVRSRAHLIAITEAGDAYSAGTMAAARDLRDGGLPMQKRWLVAGDERVCPICAPNGAQGWIRLDELFGSGHESPTAHPACRCALDVRTARPT